MKKKLLDKSNETFSGVEEDTGGEGGGYGKRETKEGEREF